MERESCAGTGRKVVPMATETSSAGETCSLQAHRSAAEKTTTVVLIGILIKHAEAKRKGMRQGKNVQQQVLETSGWKK
jgi:hypothetical protein